MVHGWTPKNKARKALTAHPALVGRAAKKEEKGRRALEKIVQHPSRARGQCEIACA